MPEASDTQGILRQNLVDAGCSPEMIRQCAALAQREKTNELLRILSLHRKMLLDTVHQNEKPTVWTILCTNWKSTVNKTILRRIFT